MRHLFLQFIWSRLFWVGYFTREPFLSTEKSADMLYSLIYCIEYIIVIQMTFNGWQGSKISTFVLRNLLNISVCFVNHDDKSHKHQLRIIWCNAIRCCTLEFDEFRSVLGFEKFYKLFEANRCFTIELHWICQVYWFNCHNTLSFKEIQKDNLFIKYAEYELDCSWKKLHVIQKLKSDYAQSFPCSWGQMSKI